MTDIKERVVWKTYPGIDFLQANQYGEVRTIDHYTEGKDGRKCFVRGHVLKQYDDTHGYMLVRPYVNGKRINLKVHRIVAKCFIPNPDNLPAVNHIDCNRANNNFNNLEWCSNSYNNQYREKYGQAFGHPLYAVNLKTGEVLQFRSQHEAARQLGISSGSVRKVLSGRYKQAGGYWFTEDENEITKKKIQKIKNGMEYRGGVVAMNLKTFKVSHFESQKEAAQQLGANKGNINGVLKGRLKKTHGYWFCYADENAVENTRAKFGDEVACEVEKLLSEEL